MKDVTAITLKELAKLSTKDLLALYNEHAAKPISRFSDHHSGFRRTKDLLESKGATLTPKPTNAAEYVASLKKARNKVLVAPESDREAVKEYHSVYAAFKALGLPIPKHQRFRTLLKRDGSATFAGFVFIATY